MATSTVTVGVPVYNGEDYLEHALESLVSQSRPPDEVLVHDNASEDASFEIANSYARKYPYVRTFRRDKNVGAALNFNELVTGSTSTYFSWLCHDDTWGPDLLRRSIQVLDDDPDVSVAFAIPNWIDTTGESIGAPPPVIWSESPVAKVRARELLANDVHSLLFDCNTVHGLIRRNCLERTRLIRPFPGGDVPLIFELALLGQLRSVPNSRFNRRKHDQSSMIANTDSWARQKFYDPSEERAPAELLERFRDYLRSTRQSGLTTGERMAVEASVLGWAMRNRRPRRIIGQLVRRLIPR